MLCRFFLCVGVLCVLLCVLSESVVSVVLSCVCLLLSKCCERCVRVCMACARWCVQVKRMMGVMLFSTYSQTLNGLNQLENMTDNNHASSLGDEHYIFWCSQELICNHFVAHGTYIHRYIHTQTDRQTETDNHKQADTDTLTDKNRHTTAPHGRNGTEKPRLGKILPPPRHGRNVLSLHC